MMKQKSVFFGLLFVILGLSLPAQIVETFRLGFESTGETNSYTVTSGTAATQSAYTFAGQSAMRLQHTNTDAVVQLDTIDLTQNSSFQFFTFEFRHIAFVNPLLGQTGSECCLIEYKALGASTWTRLQGSAGIYDMSEEYSSDFSQTHSFSKKSYTPWNSNGPIADSWWKRERFNLNFTALPLQNRKVVFRFILKSCSTTDLASSGWYIDDIVFRASPSSMATPKIKMVNWPQEMMPYPTSRSTRIDATITTVVGNGLDPDSVYMQYRLGASNNAPIYTQTMTVLSSQTNNQGGYSTLNVRGIIPFIGYDTVVSYRIVARDASTNHNMATYPNTASGWSHYTCTRGYQREASLANTTGQNLSNISDYPFPGNASAKSQFIYSQSLMEAAGYRAGSITGVRFTAGSSVSHSQRSRLVIKMVNLDADYTVETPTSGSPFFYLDDMKVVYDSSIDLTQNANTVLTLNFQDTFFYAGKSMALMFIAYNQNGSGSLVDPSGLALKGFATETGMPTLYRNAIALEAMDPNTSSNFNRGNSDNKRPDPTFLCMANMPLIYDCGVSGFITPNDTTTANAATANNVTVTLKNYGVQPINAVTLYYQVDGGAVQSYNWTGTLNGGATTNVTVSTTQTFSEGYHEMRAWVDDSLLSNGVTYRDHEPLNDTAWTRMVSCMGPMSGNVQVGGTGADYNSLDRFLYAVSQCGVGGPLHVKLASGNYDPIVVPNIPGASAANYVQFEPLNGTLGSVVFTKNQTNTTAIIDLRNTHHIRLSKITVNNDFNDYATYPIRMGINSRGCQFLGCSVVETASAAMPITTRANALLYSGGADSIVVDGCNFSRGAIGVSMVGPAADNLASGAVITNNTFDHQGTNAIVVRNHISSIVDSNSMNDLLNGSNYLMLFQDCHQRMRVTRNTAYITSGSACLGVTNFFGTSNDYAVIANNILVCADDGSANMLTTPMFVIGASYTKIVHNSVKMTAPTRAGIAAATFGGEEIDHCYFYNNIIASFDTANFAFSYVPYGSNINYIGNNIYYSRSTILNKYDGSACGNLNAWNIHISDPLSQNVNPAFLGITPTDLTTYSLNVKDHGVPIAEVTDDIFGTVRDSLAPCVGAFEFANLPYEFEIMDMVEPYAEYCNVPASAPLRVMIKNSGVNDYIPGVSGNLSLTYSRTTHAGTMVPGHSANVQVTDTIPANSTVLCSFNNQLQFPTNNNLDTTYTFYLWLTSTIDWNHINDTAAYTVTARYHPTAIQTIHDSVAYGTAATINISSTSTTGLLGSPQQPYNNSASKPYALYWYDDNNPASPWFNRGYTYTTPVLYTDDTFYVRQKRDADMMRIAEVQIKNNGVGVTYPQPLWMHAQTSFAVELVNVGDYPANLEGDTLMTIAVNTNNVNPNSALNNKTYVFPNVTVQPGQSLVVQFRTNNSTPDSTATLYATTLSPANNSNFAVLYRNKKGVVDAVAFNNMPPADGTVWTSQNIPTWAWTGDGIALNNTTAGAYRTHWNTNANAAPANSAQYWQVADSTHSMSLGTSNTNLVRYHDNGCIGDASPVYITLINVPMADLSLDSIEVADGCGLANEPVSVTVSNFGEQNTGAFAIHCVINNTLLCTDTITNVAPRGVVNHTFSQLADLYVPQGTQQFDIRVWVDHINGDNTQANDTVSATIFSSFTPAAPVVQTYDTVQYAGRLVLSSMLPPADSLRWYDRHNNYLATVNNYRTPNLFRNDTFYVSALAPLPTEVHVGQLASLNGATAYPAPFNPNKTYGQEQYLFKAQELHDAGLRPGPITSISLYLDTIHHATLGIDYTSFRVGIGATTIEAFNNSNASTKWQTLTEVFYDTTLSLTNADKGWVRFDFNAPFQWDGISNLVVGVTRQVASGGATKAQCRYTAAATGSVYHKNDNTAATISDNPGNGTLSANRPDLLFEYQDYGCEGPTSPIYVAVIGTPNSDASLSWPTDYDTLQFTSCGNTTIEVMLHNNGTDTIHQVSISYWLDSVAGTHQDTTLVATADSARISIAAHHFSPGRHSLMAVVSVPNDTIMVNDTIRRSINVSFCGGTYTIGPSAGNDYPSFAVALDTLYGAGVAGPVVFNVESGTYTEQLEIAPIAGTSRNNTVTFQSASGNAQDVKLTYSAITATANYVLKLNGAEWLNFKHLWINADGPASSSNAINLTGARNIHFTACYIDVKATNNNANASCIIVNPGVTGLYLDSNTIDHGYYSVRSMVPDAGTTSGMYFNDNNFVNFWSQGIYLRKVDDVYIRNNEVRSGVTVSSRALTGITIAEVEGGINVERNNIVLFDNMNGGKRPLVLSNCVASNIDRGRVSNNMCVAQGTGGAGGTSQGITIDSCMFMNVYYNSVRVYAGATANQTRAFSVEHNSSAINVINNIFANFSKGYAYWLNNLINVGQSNNNVFFSDTASATKKLAKIGNAELNNIDTLRMVSGKDGNSLFDQPYFHASDDLHMEFGLYNEKAQYLPDVTNDIDGSPRPAIPAPCIGAHEYIRNIHNVAIMQFLQPTFETDPHPVEADTLVVKVKLFNDGTSTESNLWWRANIVGHPELVSPTNNISEMSPGEIIYGTTFIVMPMGIIDTQRIEAFFSTDMTNDAVISNNYADTVFFIDMAFDLMVTGNDAIEVTTDVGHGEGCRLSAAPVTLTVTNKGRKPIPIDYPLTIGYQVKLPSTANYTVAQLPLVHEEQVYLNAPIGVNESVPLQFATPVNIYPTGNSRDISVRIRGWVHYEYDQKPTGNNSKDTTAGNVIVGNNTHPENSWKSVSSKYTPAAPQGNDLHIPYGTWDTIFASQSETYPGTTAGRPILWYRDSTDANPFHNPSQYARSCWWETPYYFHDSTYYLACVSASGCTSYYNPVNVVLNNRVANDVAIMPDTFYTDQTLQRPNCAIVMPYNKVFMNNDTVKVNIVNYGLSPVSNIPVYYQLRRQGNNQPVMQEVREVCTATIQPDEVYLFKFDSLVDLPTENVNYTLRVWTDLGSDGVRINDTIRHIYTFKNYPESQYDVPQVATVGGIDITHVSFSSLCNDIPEVGRTYCNFGSFNNPEVEPLHMIKGTTDTMIVEVASSDNHADYDNGGYLTVMIDYDRDGKFNNTDPELAQYGGYTEVIFADTITCHHPRKFVFTLPHDICLGHMRMRLVFEQTASSLIEYTDGGIAFQSGNVHDYLLYIEDEPMQTDVAVSRLVSPTNPIINRAGNDSTVVTVLLSNKGATPITSAEINYRVIHNGVHNDSFTWTGNIEPGHSEPVALPARWLEIGTHTYIIWANVYGDTNVNNDTLRCQFHRFDTMTFLHFADNFEAPRRINWYAPTGFNNYTQNVWEIGYPVKPVLHTAVSDSCVLATNINGLVDVNRRGNMSVIYTPIINIAQIKPDTITFWMATSLGDSTKVYLEYLNLENRWKRVGTANDTLWYNSGAGFTGHTSGGAYLKYAFPLKKHNADHGPIYQLRFVFEAQPGAVIDDGVTIDDLYVGRGPQMVDVGVIAITHPTHPKFGQTICPKVAIKNFGTDTARVVNLAYTHYGAHLPKVGRFEGTIAPGEAKLYEFPTGFVVKSDFPDTFEICAFTTVNTDIYWDNDSTCKQFALSPLDNDMGLTEFLYPLDRIVAGDSIEVTVRMRNWGQEPVTSANLTYQFNDYQVTETVNFAEVLESGGLPSFDFYNYTFKHKCRATMGTMFIQAFVDMETDDYRYNDTISKNVDGISSIYDLKAYATVVDTLFDSVRIQLIIQNVGALAVQDFEAGFWYDNDPNTLFRQTFHLAGVLPSLGSMNITFDTCLAKRQWPNGYHYVTSYVNCLNDNDHSNDTTTLLIRPYTDMRALKVLVEENRSEQCSVRLLVDNLGVLAFDRTSGINVRATINGQTITQNRVVRIEPNTPVHITFDQTIAKSPNRTYEGTGQLMGIIDVDPTNNQTSIIEVQNYFDGVPLVDHTNGMSLDQNYPNPFDANTRIDFYIPSAGNVRFFVMDVMGRLVYQSEEAFSEGNHSISFAKDDLATGVYYYGIEMDGTRLMRKMEYKR